MKFYKRPQCWKHGHIWKFDSNSMGGIWIQCERCNCLEEFIPGAHEPNGGEEVWQKYLNEGKNS